ncbi:MAG: hypothetical protein K8I02_01635, partial [Candidatus Methylomirabilis sp.]|nr:hypothetical protein [Deltaproteobacteria bacterium]
AARRREDPGFLLLVLYVLAAWIATRAINSNWTTRYFYTTTPLLLAYAARGMAFAEDRLRARRGLLHGLQVLAIAWPLGTAVAGAYLERDALGDIWRAARFLRAYAPERELRGADVSFTAAWSGRPVLPYAARDVRPNSLVILSSLPLEVRQRTTIGAEYQKLRERFEVREVFRDESVSTSLLGDVRDARTLLETLIGPEQMKHRWTRARNVTIVYAIGEAKAPPERVDSPPAP